MKASPIFKEKRIVRHTNGTIAIVEIRVWKIPYDKDYPEGRKFSLFLVASGKIIVGIDNHKPKGPHLHYYDKELPYNFVSEKKLLEDFWQLVTKEGYMT